MSASERFNNTGHWLEFDKNDSRSRCKLSGCGMLTHSFCTKCDVHLCFNRNRNCFRSYHLPIGQNTFSDERRATVPEHLKHASSTKGHCEEGDANKTKQLQRKVLIEEQCEKRPVFKIAIRNKRSRRMDFLKLRGRNESSTSTIIEATVTAKNYSEKEQTGKDNRRFLLRHVINMSTSESPHGTNQFSSATLSSSVNSGLIQGNEKNLKYEFFSYLHLSPNT